MFSDRSRRGRAFQVFAERGEFRFDPVSGRLRLELRDGDLRMAPFPSDAIDEHRISFQGFSYEFDALALGRGPLRYRADQLSLGELRQAIARIESGEERRELMFREPRVYRTQIQRLFAVPLAPLLFALVGVAMGIAGFLRSRAWGLLIGLAMLAGYYGLFSWTQTAARAGELPPGAVWLPNAALLALGVALLRAVARPR
jgi:lipopolysaccharide export system permease protein